MNTGRSRNRPPLWIPVPKNFRDSKQDNQPNRVSLAARTILLALLSLFSLAPENSAAESKPLLKVVRGSIVSAEGQPVAGAEVEIRDLRGIRVGMAFTDQAGTFEITTQAAAGEYILLAAKEPQFSDQLLTLPGANAEVKVALPSAPENIAPRPPDYTVSATQLGIPAKARAHVQLAQQEFTRMNLHAALAQIDLALQIDPQCAPAFSMRTFIKLAMKDLDGARDDAQQALALDPNDAEAFIAMSMAYNSLHDFAQATEAAQQALALNPDSWTARLEMAKSLYGQRQFVPALRELDSLQQDFPDVHLVRGNVLLQLGRDLEAADEFSAFLNEAPNDPRVAQLRRIVSRAKVTSLHPDSTQP